MPDVQLKVKVASDLKDQATQKAKAEGKSMKQLINDLLTSYVRGHSEQDPLTTIPTDPPPQEEATPIIQPLTANDFDNYLDYIDYLERMDKI